MIVSSDEKIAKFPLYCMESGRRCEFSDIRGLALSNESTKLIFSANNGLYVYDLVENLFRVTLHVEHYMDKFVMLNYDMFCGIGANIVFLIDSLTTNIIVMNKKVTTQQGEPLGLYDIAVHIGSNRMFVSYKQNIMHIFEIDKLVESFNQLKLILSKGIQQFVCQIGEVYIIIFPYWTHNDCTTNCHKILILIETNLVLVMV